MRKKHEIFTRHVVCRLLRSLTIESNENPFVKNVAFLKTFRSIKTELCLIEILFTSSFISRVECRFYVDIYLLMLTKCILHHSMHDGEDVLFIQLQD